MDAHEITHDDLVRLTARLAEDGDDAATVAYAVEKPWKYLDLIAELRGVRA